MSSNLRDPNATDREQPERSGLDPDELRAEQAGDLPTRDAMSILGVGGLEGGLPPIDTWPTEPPAEGEPIGVPDPLDGFTGDSVKV